MDELLTKQMPHSTESEQAVLGSMLIDARCIPEIMSLLRPEDFYIEANRDIFETIYTMFNYSMTIDPVTVLDQMRAAGTFKESTPDYFVQLMEITPTAANAAEYAHSVRDLALRRSVADAGSEINTLAMDGAGTAGEVLDAAEQKIYAIRQGRVTGGLEPAAKVLVDVYEHISEISRSGARLPGLSTGLPDLDNAIMGLNNSDLILIASRPGMGKTSLALQVALHVAKTSGKAVAVFSLEMSKEQLCMRLLSAASFVDNKKLQTGELSEEDWRNVAAASSQISASPLHFDDNPVLTVADMNAECRRVKDLGLVVIDYLQLMQSSGSGTSYAGENRTQVVSDISRMLKIMAKELNVPVICLSQFSRAGEKEGAIPRKPRLSDLRESGAIEQDADIVLGLYRESYYNEECEDPDVAECIVMKNRRGETGTIQLKWMPEYTSFSSIERRRFE